MKAFDLQTVEICFFCEIQQSILHGGGVFNVWVLFFFFKSKLLIISTWEKKSPALCRYFYLDSGPKYILEFLMAIHEAGFLHTIQLVASLYRQPRVIMSGNCILIIWT